MSTNIIIILTVVANLIVFGHTQTVTRDEFTLDQYYGLWYIVRVMTSVSDCNPTIVCPYLTIRERGYNSWKFQQTDYQNNVEGRVRTDRSVRGKIMYSEIHLELNPDDNDAVMNVLMFNNGSELILFGAENKLISRTRTASTEARKAFKNLARQGSMFVFATDNDDCP